MQIPSEDTYDWFPFEQAACAVLFLRRVPYGPYAYDVRVSPSRFPRLDAVEMSDRGRTNVHAATFM